MNARVDVDREDGSWVVAGLVMFWFWFWFWGILERRKRERREVGVEGESIDRNTAPFHRKSFAFFHAHHAARRAHPSNKNLDGFFRSASGV